LLRWKLASLSKSSLALSSSSSELSSSSSALCREVRPPVTSFPWVVVVVRTTAHHGDIYYDAAGNATTMPHSAALLRPQDLARAVLHNQVNVVIHLPHLTLSPQQEGEDISRRSRCGSLRRRRRGRYDAALSIALIRPHRR